MRNLEQDESETKKIEICLVSLWLLDIFRVLIVLAFLPWPFSKLIQFVWPTVAEPYDVGILVGWRTIDLRKYNVVRRNISVQPAYFMEFTN